MDRPKHTQTTKQRAQATAAAIASVRAEGLNPSRSTTLRLKRYAEGKISATQLREETLSEVRARSK
jgi:hypothetical protein